MKQRWLWATWLLVASAAMAGPAAAQFEQLKPEHWFPLDLGSYWHYSYVNASGENVVWIAERDTLVDERRWTRLKVVYVQYNLYPLGYGLWYHFTEDHYLLFDVIPDIARADTVLPTQPRSVFAVTIPLDTLQSPRRTQNPVLVEIQQGTSGSAADSTDLELTVFANDVFFEGRFVYKIGRADYLVGAVVNGLPYGDTSLITSIVLSSDDQPAGVDQGEVFLDVYPNPSLEAATIRLVADGQGRYELVVYNVLGQRVHQAAQWLSEKQEWRYALSGGTIGPGGVYVVHVRRDDRSLLAKTMIVLR